MPNRPIGELADPNFVVVRQSQTLEAVRAALGLGETAIVVDDVDDYPLYLLTEETVMTVDEAIDLGVPRPEWPRPTLTSIDTPLQTVLAAMMADVGIRWHVVYDGDKIVGVVPPQLLFAMVARPKGAGDDKEMMYELASYLGLPTAPGLLLRGMTSEQSVPLPPGLCFHCPADGAQHQVQPGQEERSVSGLALCPTHPGVRLSAENPCRAT